MEYTKITVSRRSSQEERQTALYRIYIQVLERQPYIYERAILAKHEKDFLNDKIGVKRFLRELGHSEVYLNTFYQNSSNLKFLELCFKHFMGRAPKDREEVQHYCNILMKDGVHALVTALLDSEEYRKLFGCFTVPHAQRQSVYASPKAYLESDVLNHEHIGQRGWSIPTMYWHELGLDCTAGVCQPIGQPATHRSLLPSPTKLEHLLQVIKSLDSTDVQEIAVSLSPQQRDHLRQVLAQL